MQFKKKIMKILKDCYISAYRRTHAVQTSRVLFNSFDGRSYSDNPRAISEKMHELYPETEIVWFLKHKSEVVPDYVKVVDPGSIFAYYKTIATAHVVVTNFAFPDVKKGKDQLFIQTWHGDRSFKKIQYDNPHISKDYYRAESEEGFCDLCIAGSDYGERKFRSAFRYKGEILKVGTPRNDRLVYPEPSEIKKIRDALGIENGVKILLYAPTIRKDKLNGIEIGEIDLESTRKKLEEKYNCRWVCLVRAHPGNKYISGVTADQNIIDVSRYEDMADLLLAADMLITDYSSSAGDYALLGRPLVLFQADRDDYVKNERTFYFDVKSSPYYIAENQEELEQLIEGFSDQNIKANCKEILSFYGCCESGKASETVAERIHDRIAG